MTKRRKPVYQAEIQPTPAPLAPEPLEDLRLGDVNLDEEVEIVRIDLPVYQAEALMERGLLPGCRVCPIRKSPSGDPIVMVDGVMLALRREVAGCLCVKYAARSDS